MRVSARFFQADGVSECQWVTEKIILLAFTRLGDLVKLPTV